MDCSGQRIKRRFDPTSVPPSIDLCKCPQVLYHYPRPIRLPLEGSLSAPLPRNGFHHRLRKSCPTPHVRARDVKSLLPDSIFQSPSPPDQTRPMSIFPLLLPFFLSRSTLPLTLCPTARRAHADDVDPVSLAVRAPALARAPGAAAPATGRAAHVRGGAGLGRVGLRSVDAAADRRRGGSVGAARGAGGGGQGSVERRGGRRGEGGAASRLAGRGPEDRRGRREDVAEAGEQWADGVTSAAIQLRRWDMYGATDRRQGASAGGGTVEMCRF